MKLFSILLNIIFISFFVYFYKDIFPENRVFKVPNSEFNFELYKNSKYLFSFKLDSSSGLEYIKTNNNKSYQIVYYYRDGSIKSKHSLNGDNNIIGRTYIFHPNGFLKESSTFIDNSRTGLALVFYDSLDYIKEHNFYNKQGEKYKKITFSEYGEVINTEP